MRQAASQRRGTVLPLPLGQKGNIAKRVKTPEPISKSRMPSELFRTESRSSGITMKVRNTQQLIAIHALAIRLVFVVVQ